MYDDRTPGAARVSPTAGAADELVDVLDTAGRVLRTTTRRDMRTNRLRHRSTYILVTGSDGRLLIHRRAEDKDLWPGRWDIAVGGVVAAGEKPDDAARRELAEEIGVVSSLTFLGIDSFDDEISVEAWLYTTVSDGPFVFADEEVVETEWVHPERIAALTEERAFCPDSLALYSSHLAA